MVTFSKLGHRLAAANKPLPRDAKGELVEPTSKLQQLKHHITTPWFWGTWCIFIVIFIVMISVQLWLQWFWLLLYAALIIPFAPWQSIPMRFYRGGLNDDATSTKAMLLLAASASISWVFAKSIQNASLLGAENGIVGCVAYASYYTAFFSVAFVVYFLRKKGYKSLPEAINARYGSLATIGFGLAVLFRLYQEVWSNALVVGGFYGPTHSTNWWLGACLSTMIPVIYSFTGGMRASVMTDMSQVITCIALLVALLILLGLDAPASFGTWNGAGTCELPAATDLTYQACAAAGQGALNLTKAAFTYTNASCNYPTITTEAVCTAATVGGMWSGASCALGTQPLCVAAGGVWHPVKLWSLKNGADLIIVGLLQGLLSYPFFDPVLTDRAFLNEPRTMVKSFTLGGTVAGIFILLFGFFGMFGNMQAILRPDAVPDAIFQNMKAGYPAEVAKYFGTAVYSIVNIVFITQSLSTLDSTFTSAAKLFGPEFYGIVQDGVPKPPSEATKRHLAVGRAVILVLPIVGMLPLLARPTALEATTVSGTVVMGLGPPIFALLFCDGYRPLTFHLPFWWGVGVGAVFQLSTASCCNKHIDLTGWYMGDGPNKDLLGVNVIGTIVAWGLMLLTLLENPFASTLMFDNLQGNNFVQDGKRLWRKVRGRAPLEPSPSMLPVLSKKNSDVLGLDFQPRIGDSTGPTS